VLGNRIAVAGTSKERRTGLLNHTGLGEGEGLLIVPCESVHSFGMKFAIDVVFVNKKKVVVKVRPNMVKRRIALSFRAHSVVELPVGAIERTGTEPGDQLEFEK
jgi:hypothetical protein